MSKIDHIAIAVKDISKAANFFESALGLKESARESVTSQSVDVCFLTDTSIANKQTEIELISPSSNDSPIHNFLNDKGEGLHHIGFIVDNLEQAIEKMEHNGAKLLPGYPQKGAKGKMVAFFHPKSTNGVLIEICSHS